MSENDKLREAVEAVVAEAFDAHVRALHDDIVARVIERVQPALRSGKQASNVLKSSIGAIESCGQQTQILRALLDSSILFAQRTALFVLRGTTVVGWQARGFQDNEDIRVLSIDATTGLAGRAIQQRCTAVGPATSFDRRLSPELGIPRETDCAVMPLVVRDRVAAVLYADGAREGDDGPDVAAIEILVRAAGLWIEVQALRQASGGGVPASRPTAQGTMDASPSPALSARTEAAAIPSSNGEIRPTSNAVATTMHAQTNSHGDQHGTNRMEQSSGTVNESTPPIASRTFDDLHKKARRFAKLLVDEIVLYNRDKVVEGRSRRDLYDRLKDDIDKSRATYDRRYADTPVALQDYFTQAVITGLAEENPELLGPNFVQRAVETV